MFRANVRELESIGSHTKITGIKLQCICEQCGRKWSIWFRDEDDLQNNLPENWHVCGTCSKLIY